MPRGKSPRKRRAPINRHFKIEHVLKGDVLDEYLAFLRDPCTTVDTAHAWLSERGHGGTFSRSAVARHKRHYLRGLLSLRDAQKKAQLFADLAKDPMYAGEELLDGALLQAEQFLMMTVFDLEHRPRPVTAQELMAFVQVVDHTIGLHERIEALRDKAQAREAREERRRRLDDGRLER